LVKGRHEDGDLARDVGDMRETTGAEFLASSALRFVSRGTQGRARVRLVTWRCSRIMIRKLNSSGSRRRSFRVVSMSGTGRGDVRDRVPLCLDKVDDVDKESAIDKRIQESLERNKESMKKRCCEDWMTNSSLNRAIEKTKEPSEDEDKDVLLDLLLDSSASQCQASWLTKGKSWSTRDSRTNFSENINYIDPSHYQDSIEENKSDPLVLIFDPTPEGSSAINPWDQ
jgi:hypothetical protein